jgi:predicted O-methyltransferase YrrM
MDKLDAALKVLQEFDAREIQRRGFHFQRNDYYSPLNDLEFLDANRDLWDKTEDPLDIDWNLDGQLEIARRVGAFVPELRDVPKAAQGGGVHYCWQNDFWNNADALVQYGMVRDRKPNRYVEVGCGWSSLLLNKALQRNGRPCEVNLVEPYPNRAIFKVLPQEWTRHECILQRAPMRLFEELEAGDIFFYDGSHCAKVGSDVTHFFFEILPRLKSGVIVHLHDIFLPNEYPEDWVFDRAQTWNEQYVLQAFLMNNPRYRILIANRFLFRRRAAELDTIYQGIQPSYGASFWLEKV